MSQDFEALWAALGHSVDRARFVERARAVLGHDAANEAARPPSGSPATSPHTDEAAHPAPAGRRDDVLGKLVLADVLDDSITAARPDSSSFPLRLFFGELAARLHEDAGLTLACALSFYFRGEMEEDSKAALGVEVSRAFYAFAIDPELRRRVAPLVARLLSTALGKTQLVALDDAQSFDSTSMDRDRGADPSAASPVAARSFLLRVTSTGAVRRKALVLTGQAARTAATPPRRV